jgi:hypothetical protein
MQNAKLKSLDADPFSFCILTSAFLLPNFYFSFPRCASTTVTFPLAEREASIGSGNPGLLGMPPNGSKIRRGKPQVGVACEDPLLDRKQPTVLLSSQRLNPCKSSSGFSLLYQARLHSGLRVLRPCKHHLTKC